jgi:non-lysosomal glucosylceramidase
MAHAALTGETMNRNKLTRRTFLRGSSAAGLVAAAGPLGVAKSIPAEDLSQKGKEGNAGGEGQTGWLIPACAWNRPLGSLPKIELLPERTQETGDLIGLNTSTRTKKGIPLGGVGAGNFMYNVCGSFGPWQMKPGRYEERFLSQAAFHVREELPGAAVKVRTLATDDVLPAWTRLNPGDGQYHALFPKGWCTYKGFATDISMQFFSPVIKDNYRETSYPAALFLFAIHNPGNVTAKVSIMFTFPNAPYTGPQNTPMAKADSAAAQRTFRERRGLKNRAVQHSGVTAILMEAHDAANPPETEGSEWCIATNHPATYVSSWDGAGDGSDIWKAFEAGGNLANGELAAASQIPAGALCINLELSPGARAEVPFALGWYFPQVEFGSGTRWWRRFTEWFPSAPEQSFHIAEAALQNRDNWRHAIDDWQAPILQSQAYPEWVKQLVLNELYYSTFGGSFWENGCITKPKKFGNRPGQHVSFVMECQEYSLAESFDVRHHPARSNRDLWPAQERATLLLFRDFVMDTPDGSCPHDAGAIDGDPLFAYDGYGRGYNQSPLGIKGRITTPWSELSPKFVQQCYAYWHKTRDNEFLDEVWPAMVRSYRYQVTTDLDGDGLTEMKSSEYLENKFFNAVLWLGALEMLEEVARHRNDNAFCGEVGAMLKKARASAEKQFWNAQYGYYQYNQHNDDMMGDAMIGQRYIDVTGLPPVLDRERMASHYRQLFKRGVMALKDCNGDGIGDVGVANAIHPDSLPGVGDSEYLHQFEVWTGVSYCAAANIYHCGKERDDGALQGNAMLAAWGVYYQTWVNEETAYWFSTPEAWRINDPKTFRALMYQRARGAWEFAMEISDPYQV